LEVVSFEFSFTRLPQSDYNSTILENHWNLVLQLLGLRLSQALKRLVSN